MFTKFAVGLVLVTTLATTSAWSQLPDSLRAAGITATQWAQTQNTIRIQARSLGQREDVIRTLAIEIFEARPGQSLETYISLIQAGSERLQEVLSVARALNPRGDPALEALRTQAIAAAELGRLREALALQDEYELRLEQRVAQTVEQAQLDLAAARAAGAETAATLGNLLDAVQRYGRATETAPPAATEVRWTYTLAAARAYHRHAGLQSDDARRRAARETIRLYEAALPLAARDTHAVNWAITQNDLGAALIGLSARNDLDNVRRAIAHFEQALSVRTRETDPQGWALTESNLAAGLLRLAQNGDASAIGPAIERLQRTLEVRTRGSDLAGWMETQNNLSVAYRLAGRHDEAYEAEMNAASAALELRRRYE